MDLYHNMIQRKLWAQSHPYRLIALSRTAFHFQHRFTRFLLKSGVIGNPDFAVLKANRETVCISLGGDLSN
ncbi:hypothetical protein FIC94_16055 [Ochrobactrum teleogrylli]|uniref:Uncharacterized protein n=1 Tax=Ochrobactrum teleogrylli TaxID=2479765 RepID=A0ABY2Y1Q5_9HYPH|nr:hypothetical protein FIC94_16055 [[Ochrobactrum] teleogrylli]